MGLTLFDFQEKAIPEISKLLHVYDNVLCVSPGGSGKTVIMSEISRRYIDNEIKRLSNRKVCIFVHREELYNQTREKLLSIGLISQGINSETTYIDTSVHVYVIMVETFNIRADSVNFLAHFKNIGLYFCDEAHRTDFNKIFQHFVGVKRLGFTATPISVNKKHPLKDYYQVMCEIAKVSQLHLLNEENPLMGVVPIKLYHFGDVDRDKFGLKRGEFDEKQVSAEFSKKKQIDNVIEHYFSLTKGMKILCFDADVSHSKEMTAAFKYHGINARHVNGSDKKNYRRDCREWLKYTNDAVLNNVGILTTGFDEPSVESVFINSAMMSKLLFIQKVVRVSRPYQYPNGIFKKQGIVLDFGNNASETGGNFGDCNQDEDWQEYFNNPFKSNLQGVGGFKTCPNCKGLVSASARFCNGFIEDFLSQEIVPCGYIFSFEEKEVDSVPRTMIEYFNSAIDIKKNIDFFLNGNNPSGIIYNEGKVYHETLNQIANLAFKQIKGTYLDSYQLKYFVDLSIIKIKELGKHTGKKTYKEGVKSDILTKLKNTGFYIHIDEINEAFPEQAPAT